MGTCMSSRLGSSSISSSSARTIRSSNSLSSSSKYGNIVRVVHLNGWLEEFEDPVTVGQVTGNQPKHFVFPQAQLLSLDSKPLDSAAQLELGNIYFLLPHSIFQAEMSPIDLATIYKRLTSAAQKSFKPPNPSSSSFNNNNNTTEQAADTNTAAAGMQQNKLKPNPYADRYVPPRFNTTLSITDGNSNDNKHLFYNYDHTSCDSLLMKQQQQQVGDHSPRSWKPILESIIERSFTLRSTESDSSHQDTHR
ncbi:hypothetical protein ACET3Z_020695 [Daucus carota]